MKYWNLPKRTVCSSGIYFKCLNGFPWSQEELNRSSFRPSSAAGGMREESATTNRYLALLGITVKKENVIPTESRCRRDEGGISFKVGGDVSAHFISLNMTNFFDKYLALPGMLLKNRTSFRSNRAAGGMREESATTMRYLALLGMTVKKENVIPTEFRCRREKGGISFKVGGDVSAHFVSLNMTNFFDKYLALLGMTVKKENVIPTESRCRRDEGGISLKV